MCQKLQLYNLKKNSVALSHEYFGCSKRSGCPLYEGPGQVYLENGHYGTSWEQQPGGLSQSYGQIIQRNNNAK